jgi:hypothetical protein
VSDDGRSRRRSSRLSESAHREGSRGDAEAGPGRSGADRPAAELTFRLGFLPERELARPRPDGGSSHRPREIPVRTHTRFQNPIFWYQPAVAGCDLLHLSRIPRHRRNKSTTARFGGLVRRPPIGRSDIDKRHRRSLSEGMASKPSFGPNQGKSLLAATA